MKASPIVIVLSGKFEDLSIGGAPAVQAGTLTRADFEGCWSPYGVAVGAVWPKYAAEVGLTNGPERLPDGRLRHRLTVPPAPTPALLENGRLIFRKAQTAVTTKGVRLLRTLCWWFPVVLRMPQVKAFLDCLPRRRAEQVAGKQFGRGRPADPMEAFGRVATMTALARERDIKIAEAARLLAELVPILNVTPRSLENLHSELGELVCCVDGYAVPGSELSARPWGVGGDDELQVFVRSPTG